MEQRFIRRESIKRDEKRKRERALELAEQIKAEKIESMLLTGRI